MFAFTRIGEISTIILQLLYSYQNGRDAKPGEYRQLHRQILNTLNTKTPYIRHALIQLQLWISQHFSFYLYHSKKPHVCPCGYYGDSIKPCTCAPSTVTKYQKRISGPLLDRIDIQIEVPRVDYQKLSNDRLGESPGTIRCRVESARRRQRERFSDIKSNNIICNADMRVGEIRQFCKLDEAGESLIRAVMG